MAKTRDHGTQGLLRIIGGAWRGRKLRFKPVEGLRPTADRTRETLFNWLAPMISDARCLDLFAGSGALGLEALSRGASYCDFVDRARACTQQISLHLETLKAQDRAGVHTGTAEHFLDSANGPYDLVFLDPPFGKQLLQPICSKLAASPLISPAGTIYLEWGANESEPELPDEWHLHREKRTGSVIYQLYTRGG